ncbi:arylsulfatase [Pontiellaceae bacterium B12227]|nr:arylsulfatase [Pontiellaceae bacterium B12227]
MYIKWISLFALMAAAFAGAVERPNIVVILADDVGSGDISYYRNQFMDQKPVMETPNIDALAAGGMWFTDGHSSTALCAPTRYAIMSGKNNYRSFAPWGVWNSFHEGAIKKGEATLGTVARDGGYATGFIGKWHLGLNFKRLDGKGYYRGNDKDPKPVPADMMQVAYGGPADMGFDYSYALPTGVQGPLYMAYENEKWAPFEKDSEMICVNEETAVDPVTVTAQDKKDLKLEGNMTISDKGPGMGDSKWDTSKIPDIISRKAVNFINANANKKPFFLYYCSPEAHRPHMPPAEMDGVKVRGTLPSRHMECIKVLDLEVKRIVDALKANDVFENTLVFFVADNGGLTWKVPGTMESGHRPSGNYRGAKSAPHEGGHRIPFIAHWPKYIKAGQTSDELVITHDLMATVARVAGTKLADEDTLDSTNILPILLGQDFKQRDYLAWQSGATFQVMYREGPWKLIIQSNHKLDQWDPVELYNLETNAMEDPKKNLIGHPEYKARAEKMYKKYMKIRTGGERTAPINL